MNPYSYKISQIITASETGDYLVRVNKLGRLIGDSTTFGAGNVTYLLRLLEANGDAIINETLPFVNTDETSGWQYDITVPAALRMLETYCEKQCSGEYSKKELATMKGIISKINEFMEGK